MVYITCRPTEVRRYPVADLGGQGAMPQNARDRQNTAIGCWWCIKFSVHFDVKIDNKYSR